MNTNMCTPIGMHISTPTSILIRTKNTATNILTYMIINTSTSTFTSIRTREHQMFTIMSIKVNTVLTSMTTLDTRQKFITIKIKRLEQDFGRNPETLNLRLSPPLTTPRTSHFIEGMSFRVS
jgi:hypothetical protein